MMNMSFEWKTFKLAVCLNTGLDTNAGVGYECQNGSGNEFRGSTDRSTELPPFDCCCTPEPQQDNRAGTGFLEGRYVWSEINSPLIGGGVSYASSNHRDYADDKQIHR